MSERKTKQTLTENINWYSENIQKYNQLAVKVESIIQEMLEDENITVHSISCRTKTIESFSKKIDDLKYIDPINEITDLAGIRIITYVESDLDKIVNLIEEHFEIDKDNSLDKGQVLGIDKVGYRSIHYIAELPVDRIKLPEYKKFESLKFEIQIRTILQHAWAEIEHDRDYKFTGELPAHLKRRFKVLAGVLELADREFDAIANEIDKYGATVGKDTRKGKLNIPIDSTSLKSYLEIKFKELIKLGFDPSFSDSYYELKVLTELRDFGIMTLYDFDKIIPIDFVDKMKKYRNLDSTYAGLLRHIMMIHDIDKYFESAWNKNWQSIDNSTVEMIDSYGVPITDVLAKYEIDIYPDDFFLEVDEPIFNEYSEVDEPPF